MKKLLVSCIAIAVGVLSLATAAYCIFGGRESLESPEVLEEKVLHGDSTQTKVQAARDLVRHGGAARVEIRRALTRCDPQEPEVRVVLLQATMKTRDWRSMPEILKAMEDPDPLVRGRAGAAASRIMGANFFFRANDPPKQRAKVIEEIRREFEIMKPRIEKFYATRGQ